jgi:hypothetical protein
MEMPDRNVAVAWVGRTVVDRDGVEIGACTAVFADDATELAEWVCSELDGVAVFIPAVGADGSGGKVQVAVSRDDVAAAPAVGGAQHISQDEEAALYRHYGIPHSREASPSLLPTDDAQPAEDTSATAESAPAPVTANGVAPRSQPAADRPEDESGQPPASTGGRRKLLLALGGVAGLGVTVRTVLRARRQRRKPASRAQRLVKRGRAASAALTARTGEVAAPLLETTKQAVRPPGRAGAAAAASALAASVLAARRRRSEDAPSLAAEGRRSGDGPKLVVRRRRRRSEDAPSD